MTSSLQVHLTHDGKGLAVKLPSDVLVQIPANSKGMVLLVQLLEAQLLESDHRVGTKPSPIQQVVDQFMRTGVVTKLKESGPRRPRLVKVSEGIYKRTIRNPDDTVSLDDLLGLDSDPSPEHNAALESFSSFLKGKSQ